MARSKKSKKEARSQEVKQTIDELTSLLEKLRDELLIAGYFFDTYSEGNGRAGAIGALGAVCDFINAFGDFRDERLTRPLEALMLALGDATRGTGNPMLKSIKTGGRPSSDLDTLHLKAHASVAMELYMNSGMKKSEASAEVARRLRKAGYVIPNRAKDESKDANTIEKWREKVSSGMPGKDEDTDCYQYLLAGIQVDVGCLKTTADRIIDMTPNFVRPNNPKKPPY